MKIKKGDKLPDVKVFILEKDPKEVSIKEIKPDLIFKKFEKKFFNS